MNTPMTRDAALKLLLAVASEVADNEREAMGNVEADFSDEEAAEAAEGAGFMREQGIRFRDLLRALALLGGSRP